MISIKDLYSSNNSSNVDIPLTTKGDLLTSNGLGSNLRLPVGIDGHVLIADSTESTGLRWGEISGAGSNAATLNNQLPSYYLDRTNHIGTQSYTTITGLGNVVTRNTGTQIGEVLVFSESNKLPTLDGSLLTNLPNIFTIQNKGIDLTQRSKLNFTGDLVNANDNLILESTDVIINSGLSNLGDLLYHNGTNITRLPKGTNTQVLTSNDTLGLTWVDIPSGITSYNDLTDKPSLGTASSKNSGTGAGEVLLLSENNKLPALDGSLLTNLPIDSKHIITKDNVALVSQDNLNFKGELVTVSNNSLTNSTDIDINLPTTLDLGTWTA